MKGKVILGVVFSLCLVVSTSSVEYRPDSGPVYVNPENPANHANTDRVASPALPKPTFLTQTVYGFLDFTTTIGNTVMVFSPQSSAVIDKKEVTTEPIVTKPPQTQGVAAEEESHSEISPSRPIQSSNTNEDEERPNPESDAPQQSVEASSAELGPESYSSVVSVIEGGNHEDDEEEERFEEDEETEERERDSIFSSPGEYLEGEPSIESSQVELDESEPSMDSFSSELVENTPSLSLDPTTSLRIPESSKVSSVVSVQTQVAESSPRVEVSSVVNVVGGGGDGESTVKFETTSKVAGEEEVVVGSSTDDVQAVPAISVNNIENKPEYDFLSRQPSEVVDETFKVIDLKPSAVKYPNKVRSVGNDLKSRGIGNAGKGNSVGDGYQAVGVISSMGGTVVKGGVTTVHETNVIGTFISGKYAQVLQSTSHVYQPEIIPEKKAQGQNKNIKPSATARILKTSAPNLTKQQKAPLEASPVSTLDEDNSALPLEALFSSSPGVNLIRQSRRPAIGNTPTFKNRFSNSRNRNRDDSLENKNDYGSFESNDNDAYLESDYIAPSPSAVPSFRQKTKNRGGNSPQASRQTFKYGNNRHRTQTPELATVSVFNEQSSAVPSNNGGGRKYQSPSRRPSYKKDTNSGGNSNNNLIDSNSSTGGGGHSRRGYKPKVATSGVEQPQPYNHQTTSLYKFKLTRPTGRWQYKTSPKPRVTIRRQDESLDNSTYTTPQNPDLINAPVHIDPDQDISGSGSAYYNALQHDNENALQQEPTVAAETIKVEISTPADFRNVYYEIATIKSPYSFQVGTVKNTRFITVTSTIEKSLVEPTQAPEQAEPLVENILVTTQNAYDKEPPLDSSIATLPPIGLAGDQETPPLETMTETFSTTQLLLKTHILPVIRGGANTTRYTLVQSYHVTRLVTAIKTLPPMEVYQFVPSKTLNEFNTKLDEAGSELHLELEFGDQNEDQPEMTNEQRILLSSDNIDSIGSDFDVTDLDKNIKNLSNINTGENHLRLKKAHKFTAPNQNSIPTSEPSTSTPGLTPEQLQQLAILKFLNPAAAANLPNAITTSKPVIKIETIYESHVIPLINGANTHFTTISRPVSTVSKTEYEMITSSIGFPQPPVNPLFPPLNPFAPAVTTTPIVTQTMVTQTNSKVLKLTFGAKTAFTTLYSTKVVPTMLTTYLTASVPTQATAAPFNPFFQQAYNPYNPFLG